MRKGGLALLNEWGAFSGVGERLEMREERVSQIELINCTSGRARRVGD